LQKSGDDTLKDTRYLWLKGTVPDEQQPAFSELLEMKLKTAKAWMYKETFVEFWAQADIREGKDLLRGLVSQRNAHPARQGQEGLPGPSKAI